MWDSGLGEFSFREECKLKMWIGDKGKNYENRIKRRYDWEIKVEFFEKNVKRKLEKVKKIEVLVKKGLRKWVKVKKGKVGVKKGEVVS